MLRKLLNFLEQFGIFRQRAWTLGIKTEPTLEIVLRLAVISIESCDQTRANFRPGLSRKLSLRRGKHLRRPDRIPACELVPGCIALPPFRVRSVIRHMEHMNRWLWVIKLLAEDGVRINGPSPIDRIILPI